MMRALSRRLLMAVAILGCARITSAQTADEIIEKYPTAIGGRAALAKITSRSTTGAMTLSTPTGTGAIDILKHNVKMDEALFSRPATEK
jgi:hypothetical protein